MRRLVILLGLMLIVIGYRSEFETYARDTVGHMDKKGLYAEGGYGEFCNTLYSQNISDTVKDVVISIEYDKVYDEFHHIAKIKDFCSSNYDNGYSDERYGSPKYYKEVYNEAYKEATRNIDSRKMGAFIYSFMPDRHKRKLGNQGWGILIFNLSKTEGLVKYSLTIRTDEGIKTGRVFTKDDCLNIFHALDTSIFNSWSEDIGYLVGGIKFRLQEPEEEAFGWNYHEELPKFNGGDPKLMTQWVKERQVYPKKALELGLEGRVTMQFTISEKGKLKNVKVLRGVHKSLDKVSLRLVKSTAGLWTPGEDLHHKPCSRTFTFPVIWELPETVIPLARNRHPRLARNRHPRLDRNRHPRLDRGS